MPDVNVQRKKYTKLILLGVFLPVVMIVVGVLMGVVIRSLPEGALGAIVRLLGFLLSFFGFLGIFTWGPVLWIIGIVKMNKLKPTDTTMPPVQPQQVVNNQQPTQVDQNNNQGPTV